MLLPPKLTAILLGQLLAVTMLSGSTQGQQADYERRMAAMQEARIRAQIPANQSMRVASSDMGVDYSAPPAPPAARVARAPKPRRVVLGQTSQPRQVRVSAAQQQTQTSRPVTRARTSRTVQQPVQPQNYVPAHQRTAQLMGDTFIDGGSPIMSGQIINGPIVNAPMMGTHMGAPVGDVIVGESYVDAGAVGCGSCGGGVVDGGCGSCGDAGGYFEDQCCGRGGCPPGDCWLTGIGALLYHGEYFGGATSFRSGLFPTPGGTAGALSNDCSHGFYGGFNFGMPLCKLSCGVFSGQIGVRAIQTNFDGNEFTANERDQLFVTAGFFRRVDYGLQLGVVGDFLQEEWFTDTSIIQIRSEISWVYPSGSIFGFRYATNTQDDITSGTFAGNAFTGLQTSSQQWSRFFYRNEGFGNGYGEVFLGWTDNDQTIIGLDFDRAIGERLAMQAGFTYYLNDEGLPAGSTALGGNVGDAYNLYVGFSLRPRGVSYYKSYDRPLFSVADNGTMLITRQ